MDNQKLYVLVVRGDLLNGWCTVGPCVSIRLVAGHLSVKASYTPFEICPRSIESFLKVSSPNTHKETDYEINNGNKKTDKVSQYYKTLQHPGKEQVSNSAIKQSNSMTHNTTTITNDGCKTPDFRSAGPVQESVAVLPPEEVKVLQSLNHMPMPR
ncbi:hypothetical protein AVEN_230490-1 [Araneus ventricosus]|uniref:Uncharacterized protein n=1 Tax=Araneus ventricosus TaxID=182803 RepID=A0A4Y2IFA0_ARAVE|nr:hypothetical protein AVEN_230490-1 [Araneus ventricosus]